MIIKKAGIVIFAVIMTALMVVGFALWTPYLQGHDLQPANINIEGDIDGKPFFLFASSRLQHSIPSAIIVQHKSSLIIVSMSQTGSHTVLVKFSYAIRHGYFVHGEATIPTNEEHGVRFPLSNPKDHLKIMVLEHD